MKSLAGSGKEYVECQVTIRDNSQVHVQVPGPEINRDYGAAFDGTVSDEDLNTLYKFLWLSHESGKTTTSMAGTDREYVVCQYRMYDNDVHVQCAGPAVNRDYGLAFTMETEDSDVAKKAFAAIAE